MLDSLFPEKIFARKLSPDAERRLKLVQARAEEALIRAHVENALMFVDVLTEEASFDRAIDIYIRSMAIPEPLASTVATRTLVALSQELVPFGPGQGRGDEVTPASDEPRPRLRLDEALAARQRVIRKGA